MKVRIKLTKAGSIRFVGHLDFMRFFQKALRRSGIACAFSGGYSPHLLISFASPLGVGLESVGEYVDVELAYRDPFPMERDDLEKLKAMGLENEKLPDVPPSECLLAQLNRVFPEGVSALEMRRVEENRGKAMAMVRGADYLVFRKDGFLAEITDAKKLSAFLGQEAIVIHKVSKKTEGDADIRPLLYTLKTCTLEEASQILRVSMGDETACPQQDFQSQSGGFAEIPPLPGGSSRPDAEALCRELADAGYPRPVFLSVSAGSAANLKPETVLEAFASFVGAEYDPEAFRILRTEMYGPGGKRLGELGLAF